MILILSQSASILLTDRWLKIVRRPLKFEVNILFDVELAEPFDEDVEPFSKLNT